MLEIIATLIIPALMNMPIVFSDGEPHQSGFHQRGVYAIEMSLSIRRPSEHDESRRPVVRKGWPPGKRGQNGNSE